MKSIFLIILCTCSLTLLSQNLVLNPSFEEYIKFTDGWPLKAGESYCKNWKAGHNSYILYYHRNSPNRDFSVPQNQFGLHYPASGDAYIGFNLFYWDGGQNFVTGKLNNPLQKGRMYKISYKVQFCSCSRFFFSLFGAKLSRDSVIIPYVYPFYNEYIGPNKIKADIENSPGNFIENDSSWTLVEGTYKAKGGEQFIMLGGPFYHVGLSERINDFIRISLKRNKRKIYRFYKKNQDVLKLNPNYCPDELVLFKAPFYLFDDVSVELIE